MNRWYRIAVPLLVFALGCGGAASEASSSVGSDGAPDADQTDAVEVEDVERPDAALSADAGHPDGRSTEDIELPESGLPSDAAIEAASPLTDGGDVTADAGSVGNNPPIPDGWRLMQQAEVTPEITAWTVAILHDPATYPMFSSTMQMFGTLLVLARVEWHPPDFQNSTVHRGVTLYVPL